MLLSTELPKSVILTVSESARHLKHPALPCLCKVDFAESTAPAKHPDLNSRDGNQGVSRSPSWPCKVSCPCGWGWDLKRCESQVQSPSKLGHLELELVGEQGVLGLEQAVRAGTPDSWLKLTEHTALWACVMYVAAQGQDTISPSNRF